MWKGSLMKNQQRILTWLVERWALRSLVAHYFGFRPTNYAFASRSRQLFWAKEVWKTAHTPNGKTELAAAEADKSILVGNKEIVYILQGRIYHLLISLKPPSSPLIHIGFPAICILTLCLHILRFANMLIISCWWSACRRAWHTDYTFKPSFLLK